MNNMDQLLVEILSTPSPSGSEGAIQAICRRELEPLADGIRTDSIGNLIAAIGAGAGKMRLMLAAHCDEISCMVTGYNEEGLLFFAPVAGIDPQVAAGQSVLIHTDGQQIPAVVGIKPIHLQTAKERDQLTPFDEMVIDAGFCSKDEAVQKVTIGDKITFAAQPQQLANGRFTGRGLDDRLGIYILIEAMKRLSETPLKRIEIAAVSTVQEEVGLRGATVGSYGISPDLAVIIESGHSSDTPGIKKQTIGDIALGKGAVLSRGPNIDEELLATFRNVAARDDIPVQLKPEPRATGTDANVVQISGVGVKTALVRFPIRYMHSPCEVADMADVESMIDLLVAGIVELDASFG